MRRVLIVSPHFPPINAPDHQRVRMALPYLRECGWEATTLAVRAEDVEGTRDPMLERTLPADARIERVAAISTKLTRPLGFGSLALRALPALSRAGSRLLARERFDLVFFSTTMFATMSLGPKWKRRFGVPYVLDFQDPWLSDFYDRPGAPPPPGGRLKYTFALASARRREPAAVRDAAAIVSVSPAYPDTLAARYPEVSRDRFEVLPFGAPEADFDFIRDNDVRQSVFERGPGIRHWVYVGRGGGDMRPALAALFAALAKLRAANSSALDSLKLHFVGTSYAPPGRAVETVRPVAAEFGVADLVEEYTSRVPYHESLRLMVDADLVLLVGSTDASYTASKLYPCILSGRPILAIFHERSSVVSIMRECRAGRCVEFGDDRAPDADEVANAIEWGLAAPRDHGPSLDAAAFSKYTARAMTQRLCAVFDRAVAAP